MALAVLSLASSQGIWIVCDDAATRVLAEARWNDAESRTLQTGIGPSFDRVMKATGIGSGESLRGLFGLSGPGAFTGLRMSGAWLQGLARALKVPLRAIPSFDLLGESFYIPLRHQLARTMDLKIALEAGVEFLKISGPGNFAIENPPTGAAAGSGARSSPGTAARILGLKDFPMWPDAPMLLAGLRRNLHAPEGLRIHYGLEPKISGLRA